MGRETVRQFSVLYVYSGLLGNVGTLFRLGDFLVQFAADSAYGGLVGERTCDGGNVSLDSLILVHVYHIEDDPSVLLRIYAGHVKVRNVLVNLAVISPAAGI